MTAPSSTPPPGLAEPQETLVGFGDPPLEAELLLEEGGRESPAHEGQTGGDPGSDDSSYGLVGLAVAGLLSFCVFAFFNWPQPGDWADIGGPLLFTDTTPSGGDMGAHVWGPAYLRDNLLPQGRLSGWTPDWYAGFPAYHFYMVVPPLLIVAVNAGLPWYLGLPMAAAVLYGAVRVAPRLPVPRAVVWIPAVAAAIMLVAVPYGVSFKLVTVIGLIGFPLAAWKMGRLAGAPEPVPTFLALAGFVFLFDTNFTIYGGNIASTLAGEFSFSISLMLVLLAIGLVAKGMDTGTMRASAAVIIGLVALTHVLPVFFMIPALALLVLMHRGSSRVWVGLATVAIALIPRVLRFAEDSAVQVLLAVAAILVVLAVIGLAMAVDPRITERAKWLLLTGPVAILVASFWLVPFALRRDFFNDMGWEPLEHVGPAMLTVPMKIALPIAAIGVVLAYASRERIGVVFTGTGALFAAAVANVVWDGPVWNARLLPFYYLSVYMLAAVGLGLLVRLLGSIASDDMKRPDVRVLWAGAALAAVGVLLAVAMPLRILPGGQRTETGAYKWLVFSNSARSFVPSWIEWNYSGYEEKDSYREYRQVVDTMATVGDENGCGRAMWEHHKDLDRYGTPMALMLLPHWTDGCIGSMEGLYFESSASTPFHFLNQSMLSDEPSRPQRDLPYQSFDINRGVAQLQTSGVRYYMAQSDVAIEAARSHPDLVEVGEAQPFVMFEVSGSELVQGLSVEPLVVSGRTAADVAGEVEGETEPPTRFEVGWVSQAVEYYNDPDAFPALPAEDGPSDWTRSTTLQPTATRVIDPVAVSGIEVDTNRISFSVDRVGSPVVVKASYFPNWKVEGAEGPWRVGPNQMVVVPTSENVKLSYGRSAVDVAGIVLSLLGFAAVAALAAADRGRRWWPLTTVGTVSGAAEAAALHGESAGDPQPGEQGLHADPFDDALFDGPAFDDPAFDPTAFDDPALDDPAFDDPALDPPAFDDPAVEVGGEATGGEWDGGDGRPRE